MKQKIYLYKDIRGWINQSLCEQVDEKVFTLIGTVDLDVEQPMKEVVKRIPPFNSPLLKVEGIPSYFWVQGRVPPDAYDIIIEYKQKVKA